MVESLRRGERRAGGWKVEAWKAKVEGWKVGGKTGRARGGLMVLGRRRRWRCWGAERLIGMMGLVWFLAREGRWVLARRSLCAAEKECEVEWVCLKPKRLTGIVRRRT